MTQVTVVIMKKVEGRRWKATILPLATRYLPLFSAQVTEVITNQNLKP
jgi:hypothetical protein